MRFNARHISKIFGHIAFENEKQAPQAVVHTHTQNKRSLGATGHSTLTFELASEWVPGEIWHSRTVSHPSYINNNGSKAQLISAGYNGYGSISGNVNQQGQLRPCENIGMTPVQSQRKMVFQPSFRVQQHGKQNSQLLQPGGQLERVYSDTSEQKAHEQECPFDQSTAVRLERIPESASLLEIFSKIYEGKVVLFSMQPAKPIRGFDTCSARVVFQTRDAA